MSKMVRVSSDFKQWLDRNSKDISKVRLTQLLADKLRERKYKI